MSDEKILLHYVERETPLFDKESRPIFFRNSIDWMNFNSCLTEWSSDIDADFTILLWLMPDNFTCQSGRTLSDQGVKQSITDTRYDTAHFYSVQVV